MEVGQHGDAPQQAHEQISKAEVVRRHVVILTLESERCFQCDQDRPRHGGSLRDEWRQRGETPALLIDRRPLPGRILLPYQRKIQRGTARPDALLCGARERMYGIRQVSAGAAEQGHAQHILAAFWTLARRRRDEYEGMRHCVIAPHLVGIRGRRRFEEIRIWA